MRNILVLFVVAMLAVLAGPGASGQIHIDHSCTSLGSVPENYINQAKSMFRVWYGHTSHGSQITTGMEGLMDHYGSPYDYNWDGEDGALSYQETGGDLGHQGDLAWYTATRAQLNSPGNDRNVVIWSWCGGCSDNTEEGINTYLGAMNQLEQDYPGVLFIYMTGHLDIWSYSNLKARNQQIRNYCLANNKILFDFADIESYNPDGTYFDYGHDSCGYYDGPGGTLLGNWAEEWCAAHPGSDLCWSCDCAHSEALNCNLKGRAFWWMMARMAGWPGTGGPQETPTPGPTPTPPACADTGVSLWMPQSMYFPGHTFHLSATVCNAEGHRLDGVPLFVILDVYGQYFFGPSFGAYDNYLGQYPSFEPGNTVFDVLPPFSWPAGVGSASGIYFHAALTNPQISSLMGQMDSVSFGWGQ